MLLRYARRMDAKGCLGQSLVEYALILALVSVMCVGALTDVKSGINTTLGNVTQALETSGSNGQNGGPVDE